jgi:hypothetical protein
MLHKGPFERTFFLEHSTQNEKQAEDVLISVEPVLNPVEKPYMPGNAEMHKEVMRTFAHNRKDLLDNSLEDSDFPVSKTGSEESCDLDITGISVPVREIYGVVQKPFLKIILLVKPVECAL